jgi:two-component system OmpR family response regulator
VVLDLMLPGMDGMVVCRQIRDVSDVPILILTAREDTYDEVSGLEQGADDFVNKPVQPRVLLARLRALLRRTQTKPAAETRELEFGALRIMTDDRSVTGAASSACSAIPNTSCCWCWPKRPAACCRATNC